MKRQALAAALLAVLAGTPLLAVLGGSKARYVAGSLAGLPGRTEGRLNTWNLSTLNFTPDLRGIKPLSIKYKSITSLEYGRTPGRRGSAMLAPSFGNKQTHYLTIAYTQADEQDEQAEKDRQEKPEPKDPKDKDKLQQKKATEHTVAFELGDDILRPTLRIVETRSGKRITFQDAAARKAAR